MGVCVCSLRCTSMQCACAILSPVTCPTLQYFPKLSYINDTIFERKKKKVTEHKMCVSIFCTTFV